MRFFAFLLVAASAVAQHNPVLPGDYPDPSVIRIGNDYWATATTSQWAPVYPILHSTDMVHWKTDGAVFAEPPAWSETNYWAP
jgi:beta-xylosidase